MNNELLYQIALTQVPHIGDIHARALLNVYGNAPAVFQAPKKHLEKIDGIGSIRANSIKKFTCFHNCEEEIAFIEKYKVTTLCVNDNGYPQRLLNCYDAPFLLYYRGNADLNSRKIVAVIGTRNNSDYGKQVCENIIEQLKGSNILVVSGLAFGIDSIAHRAALKNGLDTVAVVAHGLDRIYPVQNKNLAKLMTEQGGILTDFKSGTAPDRQNFPKRNRIVAGICDALLVVESAQKGGSLITATIANSYNKDVLAIPGRINDAKSEGCNYLIKSNKAALISNADDLLETMGWNDPKKQAATKQRELFIELTAEEKLLTGILQQKEICSIDELYLKSGLNSSAAAQALLMLEMQGVIISMPGKTYRLA